MPLVLIFVFLFIFPYNFFINIRSQFYPLASSPLTFFQKNYFNLKKFFHLHAAEQENVILKKELDRLKGEVSALRGLESENRRLRQLLVFKDKAEHDYIPAEVIGRDPLEWYSALIINKGRDEGIRFNMAVISPAGIVGRVVEVGRSSSKVLLITDNNSRIAAVVERSRETGIIEGNGNGECLFKYLPLDADIRPEDMIVTSALSRIFPEGLFAGRVVSVSTARSQLYKIALIKPAKEFSQMEEVFCVK